MHSHSEHRKLLLYSGRRTGWAWSKQVALFDVNTGEWEVVADAPTVALLGLTIEVEVELLVALQ